MSELIRKVLKGEVSKVAPEVKTVDNMRTFLSKRGLDIDKIGFPDLPRMKGKEEVGEYNVGFEHVTVTSKKSDGEFLSVHGVYWTQSKQSPKDGGYDEICTPSAYKFSIEKDAFKIEKLARSAAEYYQKRQYLMQT